MRLQQTHRLLAVGLAAAAFALYGCSSDSGDASAVPSEATSTQPAATPSASPDGNPAAGSGAGCKLVPSLIPGRSAGGTGSATLKLKHIGNTSCVLQGYPSLELSGARGPVPTNAHQELPPGPSQVVLGPQMQALVNIKWTTVPAAGEPANPCQPTAQRLLVTPPGGPTQYIIPWTHGPVCDGGHFHISAIYQ